MLKRKLIIKSIRENILLVTLIFFALFYCYLTFDFLLCDYFQMLNDKDANLKFTIIDFIIYNKDIICVILVSTITYFRAYSYFIKIREKLFSILLMLGYKYRSIRKYIIAEIFFFSASAFCLSSLIYLIYWYTTYHVISICLLQLEVAFFLIGLFNFLLYSNIVIKLCVKNSIYQLYYLGEVK